MNRHSRTRLLRRMPWIVLLLVVLNPGIAFSTWSIVAVDPQSGEVGSAGASFTPAVWAILGLVGGKGVVVAQAATNLQAKRDAMELLRQEVPPVEIVDRLTDPAFDAGFQAQQYGIATLYDGTAAFTGAACDGWAGHVGNDVVMIQGNILTGPDVAEEALLAYEAASRRGLPLADRLVAAMVAASAAGGDSRAGDATAMTAYLAVALPDDPPGTASIALVVPPQQAGINPVSVLADRFTTGRDSLSIARFPAMPVVWIVFLVLPLLSGISTGLTLLFAARPRNRALSLTIALVAAPASALLLYALLRFVAGLYHVVLPIYGSVQVAFLAGFGLVPVAVVLIGIGLRAVIAVLLRRNRTA